jgi:small subunit ribosomal protein S20
MPNIQSSIRRTKRTKIQTQVNRLRKSKYKSAIKRMSNYINNGKTKEAEKFLPEFHSQLMKVAKTGAISRQTASRKISRISKKIKNKK